MTTDGDRVRAARDTLYRRLGVTLVDDKILTDLDNLAAYLDEEDVDDVEILRRERDEAIARAEAAEVALTDLREALVELRTEARDDFATVAECEPWRVLRMAQDIHASLSHGYEALDQIAARLEAEHNAEADCDALIEKAAKRMASFDPTNPDGWQGMKEWERDNYREMARALHSAGLLQEADQ